MAESFEKVCQSDHDRMNFWWRRARAAEARIAELERELRSAAPDLRRVTRVSVIGTEGQLFEQWGIYPDGAELMIQDDGATLKIRPAGR